MAAFDQRIANLLTNTHFIQDFLNMPSNKEGQAIPSVTFRTRQGDNCLSVS